jgi:pSer/pThr/pTyr-binding forkhead associated (FHA) protein
VATGLGFIRGTLIRMLGGQQAEPTPPAPVPGAYPYGPYPPAPPQEALRPAPPVPSLYAPAASSWPEMPVTAPPYVPPAAGPMPPLPTGPATAISRANIEEEEEGAKTSAISGVDLDKLKIPKNHYTLQILHVDATWHDFGPIHANGLKVGRARNSAAFPGLGSMAPGHLRFYYDHSQLMVEDLNSLNGVYLRVSQPAELKDGMRFRIGNQVIEFREPEPFEALDPKRSADDEEFYSRDLEPLAFLDLIRPDTLPGLRFPITKPDVTVIGREGEKVAIALTGDSVVSRQHAQLRRQDGKFFLDDLESANGTFIQLTGSSPLKSGDVILAGQVYLRVVDDARR